MTVRRGSKEFNQALDGAIKIRSFTFSNGFSGREMSDVNSSFHLRGLLARFDFAKLICNGPERYTLRVHGKEWYEFEVKAAGAGN